MTTYTCPEAMEISMAADGAPVVSTYKAGETVTPKSDAEAQVFADLLAAGIVSVAAAKPTKTKAPAEETE